MRAVVQRAADAAVSVEGRTVGRLDGPGLVVFVGAGVGDTAASAAALAEKLWHLRVFGDEESRMNRSCADLGAPLLVVSQFTLLADTSRGRRPSFRDAMAPAEAEELLESLVSALRRHGASVSTGVFGAHMLVELSNDGPVTLVLDV